MLNQNISKSSGYLGALLIALAGLFSGCAGIPATDTSPAAEKQNLALTEEQVSLNLQSFDKVWETIRDRHWDSELGGINWEEVKQELRPKVAEAKTMSMARSIMSEMIARLEMSHFAVIPGHVYDEVSLAEEQEPMAAEPTNSSTSVQETVKSNNSAAASKQDSMVKTEESPKKKKRRSLSGNGSLGIEVRVLQKEVVVYKIQDGSAADQAGVKPGWRIDEIDERKCAKTIERISEGLEEGAEAELQMTHAMQGQLGGKVGDTVSLSFSATDDQSKQLDIVLEKRPGKSVKLGHMPSVNINFESKKLSEKIGYIHFNMFMDPGLVNTGFRTALSEFSDCTGVVIDLRGNPGGLGAMAMGMSGHLVEEKGKMLGTMIMRDHEMRFIVFPQAQVYKGKVAVLIDGGSASTSEIFAQGLKDLNRARIFGTQSCGAALPSEFQRLPNGDGFQFAFADYISTGGLRLEGQGVKPDEEVHCTRAALLKGIDPALEASVNWINQN